MKLIPSNKQEFCFELQPREKQILAKVLGLYPLVPPAHHRVSQSEDRPEAQELLNEALAVQRRESKAQVELFLQSFFRTEDKSYRISLKPAKMEWLLQVLNDIRVGSWLLLGSPESLEAKLETLNESNAPHFWTMEMAGGFQYFLLQAFNGADKPEPPAVA